MPSRSVSALRPIAIALARGGNTGAGIDPQLDAGHLLDMPAQFFRRPTL